MPEHNPLMKNAKGTESATLARFAAELTYQDIPSHVIDRTVDLFVDWTGSTLSGKGHKAITILENFAKTMGPMDGSCEVLTNRLHTSPLFAALVNGAACHISEQDDVHNGSVFHPAAVVIPVALATAQQTGATGKQFITACVAGYEVGIRVGEFLGRSHYKVFHTTGTAGTFAAAAAAGQIYGLNPEKMLQAFGSAGTQSAGLWEFLRDAADSKQLHTGKAAAEGLMAAWIASQGFTGATKILEGAQGMAAGMSDDADPARILDRLSSRWCVMETSFKFHASCRHTHPAADALLQVVTQHNLAAEDITHITAHVHQGAIDVLGPVTNPVSVHQAKFSMPATLGLIATHRKAGLTEFSRVLEDKTALSFLNRVTMELDPETDSLYPKQWIGKVSVTTKDRSTYTGRVDEPKGDPGNTLSRDEIDLKARALALSGGAINNSELDKLMDYVWQIHKADKITALLQSQESLQVL